MADTNFVRLLEVQEKGIEKTEDDSKKLLEFRAQYESVSQKLEGLEQCFSKFAYLPFGPRALVPGKLVHTNEVLVHLGGSDNYFAEMSTFEAKTLILNRIRRIDETLKSLNEQKHLIQTRSKYTSEFSKLKTSHAKAEVEVPDEQEVELIEQYDSETELTWRQQHAESRRRERVQMKNQASPPLLTRRVRFAEETDESDDASDSSSNGRILFQHSYHPTLSIRTEVSDLSTLTIAEAVDMVNNHGKILCLPSPAVQPFGSIVEHTPTHLDSFTSLPNSSPTDLPPTNISRFRSARTRARVQ